MAFIQYKGSPDIFEKETGKRLTEQEAQTAGLFLPENKLSPDVEIISTPRPDITQESQFALKSGTNITAEDLSSTPIVKLPAPITDSTDYNSIVAGTTQAQKDVTTAKTEQSAIMERIKGLYGDVSGKEAYQEQLIGEKGIVQQEKDIQDLTNQLQSIQAETQASKLGVEEKGRLTGLVSGERAEIERQGAIRALTTSSQLQAKQGNLQLALNQVSRAVDLKYKPLENELTNKLKQLELLEKYVLSPAEERRKEELKAEATVKAEKLKDKKTAESEFNKLVIDAQAGGLPLSEAQSARDLFDQLYETGRIDEAYSVIMPYTSKAEKLDIARERLELAKEKEEKKDRISGGMESGIAVRDADSVMAGTLNLQDISQKDNYRAGVAAELSKRFAEAKKSGDIQGMMKASAVYDKEPSDTFLQSMEKTVTVLSQIGELQNTLQNGVTKGSIDYSYINPDGTTKSGSVKTGPIIGALKSANPWDTQAQVIKAQLNAIVPNLARGVYGEVGVLTDNDIKQYAKTLPTLTSTEDIRNAVLYITVDQIRKNVDIKIKNQAAGQRDMSGYSGIHEDLTTQANEILSTIGGGNMSDISNDEFLKIPDAPKTTTPTTTDNKSFFGGIYNWLIGK